LHARCTELPALIIRRRAVNPLVKMVAAIDDDPTIEQVDDILMELRRMPRDHRVIGLIDDLLDYRSQLAA
jgi:hypothetical protein